MDVWRRFQLLGFGATSLLQLDYCVATCMESWVLALIFHRLFNFRPSNQFSWFDATQFNRTAMKSPQTSCSYSWGSVRLNTLDLTYFDSQINKTNSIAFRFRFRGKTDQIEKKITIPSILCCFEIFTMPYALCRMGFLNINTNMRNPSSILELKLKMSCPCQCHIVTNCRVQIEVSLRAIGVTTTISRLSYTVE